MKKKETLIYIANILIGFVMLATDTKNADKVGFLGLMLFSGNVAAYLASFSINNKTTDSNKGIREQKGRWHMGKLSDSREKRVYGTSAAIAAFYMALMEILMKQWQVKVLFAVMVIALNMNSLIEFCTGSSKDK